MNYPCDFSNGLRSPHAIELLLWYHTRCEPHPRIAVPVVFAETQALFALGAIKEEGGCIFATTDMGKAWVQALTQCPPPRRIWVDSNGKPL